MVEWDEEKSNTWNIVEITFEDDNWSYIYEEDSSLDKIHVVSRKVGDILSGESTKLYFQDKEHSTDLVLSYWKEDEIRVRGQVYQPFQGKMLEELPKASQANIYWPKKLVLNSMNTEYLSLDARFGRLTLDFESPTDPQNIWDGMCEASYAVREIQETYDRICLTEK